MLKYLRVDKIDKLIKGKFVIWLTKKCNNCFCLKLYAIFVVDTYFGMEGVELLEYDPILIRHAIWHDFCKGLVFENVSKLSPFAIVCIQL